jgi:hypothetical protein
LDASFSAGMAITHSFVARGCKRVIAVADDAGNQRWFELDHHVPRQISVLRRFARNSPSQKTGPCSRHSIYTNSGSALETRASDGVLHRDGV